MSSGTREWLVGVHAVATALEHDPERVEEVLVTTGRQNQRLRELTERAKGAGVAVHRRAPDAMDKLAGGARHQGIAARYVPPPAYGEQDLAELVAGASGEAVVLVLDGIKDPHNLGACLRTADAANVACAVVPKDKAVGLTPTVRKVAAGAADRVPLVRVPNLVRALDELKAIGLWVVGTADEAERSLYEVDLSGPLALVMGGEERGLRRRTRDHCDRLVKIPLAGSVSSLNVSVATGIALFEARRQHDNLA